MDFSLIDYASTDFGSVNTASGRLSVERDYIAITDHPDPRVRKEEHDHCRRTYSRDTVG